MRKRFIRRTGIAVVMGTFIAVTGAQAGGVPAEAADACPWVGSSASPSQRADLVLTQMTLNEKIHMMAGVPHPDGIYTTGYIAPIERLCVPELTFIDGPAGIHYAAGQNPVQPPATALPAPVALTASFDRNLAMRYGRVLGSEARSSGQKVLFAPMVNIARVPVGGRNFETLGEDPYLAGEMGVGEIQGIQDQGVIADVKHYVANNQEQDRRMVNAVVDERTLNEIYLPAFEAAVTRGRVGSVMCAYNKVNGPYSCENDPLLNGVLKQRWGFDGFVLSDYGATHSTVEAANAGLDMELPRGAHYSLDKLTAAVRDGSISIDTIDDHVRRILTVMFRFGLFEPQPPVDPIPVREHGAFARDVAAQGMVLLKNDHSTLPLNAGQLKSVAVLGPAADGAMTGGGGSSKVVPFYTVDPVQGIKNRVGDGVTVRFARGTSEDVLPPVPSAVLSPPGQPGSHGLRGEYFANQDFAGSPAVTRTDPTIDFDWGNDSPDPALPADHYSVRWSATLTAPVTGDYTFALTSDDGSRMYVNGQQLIDNWGAHAPRTVTGAIHLDAGQAYDVRVDYFEKGRTASVRLGWLPPQDKTPLEQAVDLARDSDVAVVMVGDKRRENADLPDLSLSEEENALIDAVAAVNPNTVVVLKSGGPILMPWAGRVPAIVEAWYPGEEDGNAVAALLFGDINPSGKLPVTFPARETDTPLRSESQYPGVDGNAYYSEGLEVGYRWYDAQNIAPLFPFGYGLSYTTFAVHDLTVARADLPTGAPVTVQAEVTNTGDRAGAEVVQLYLSFPPGVGEPPRQLKEFRKVWLAPGQTKRLVFTLHPRDLSYWEVDTDRWVQPVGDFQVMVGTSSRDLPLRTTVKVRAAR